MKSACQLWFSVEISPAVKQQALAFDFPAVTVLAVERKEFISKSRLQLVMPVCFAKLRISQ